MLALALGACGGGGLSADDYRSQLDDACGEITEKNQQLPRIQNDQNLSSEEVEELADDNGDEFEAKVEDLDPPTDLADEHRELLDSFDDPKPESREDFVAVLEEGADLYERIGASGCESGLRRSLEVFQAEVPAPTTP